MSKPLELIWYKLDEDGDYMHPAQFFVSSIDVDYWVECKRLSDADMAAEYWNYAAHFNKMQWNEEVLQAQGDSPYPEDMWDGLSARLNTLYRFATAPDHDQDEPTP